MNAQVPIRSEMVAVNESPESMAVLSSGQSTCWEFGLEASWCTALSLLRTVIEVLPEMELVFGLTPELLSVRVRPDAVESGVGDEPPPQAASHSKHKTAPDTDFFKPIIIISFRWSVCFVDTPNPQAWMGTSAKPTKENDHVCHRRNSSLPRQRSGRGTRRPSPTSGRDSMARPRDRR